MGEVTFTWKYGGNEVKIFGSFNNWNGEDMNKDERGIFFLTKNLSKGAYEYKYTVDGKWCYDVEQRHLTDKNGNCNNVISVDFVLLVPFWWKLSGRRVFLTGTFNNWGSHQIPMDEVRISENSTKHYKEIPLPLGFYQYKFIADDRWGYDDHQPHNYFDGVLNNYRQVNTGQTELLYFHSQRYNIGLQYLGYLPPNYRNGQSHPLILYLHEAKFRGDTVQLMEQQGIGEKLKIGNSFDFIVLAPQCPRNGTFAKWTSCTEYLMELLEHFCSSRNVDRSRIYVTGPEMGAYGAWKLVTSYPNYFAAVAVFAGGVDKGKVKNVIHVPLWACDNCYRETFHETSEVVDIMKKQGGNVRWISSNSKGDYWSDWYQSEELYNWFKQFRT